jgi:steroid 5-alpha reductase family enzyme
MSPLVVVIIIAACACAFAWIASIVPVIYVWIFAGFAHFANTRLDVMAALVTVWGARLTFNFARKGGYSGIEDYRWGVLRSSMSQSRFLIFNFFFIVLYQNFLLVLITLPALNAFTHRSTPFGLLDLFLATLFFVATTGETIADQEQWEFQSWKKGQIAEGRTPEPQFLQSGLFRSSRHPNFFFEQFQWWVLFLMGTVAAGSLLQWTIMGPFLLTLLFLGSTAFTEKITLSHYPEYAQYRRSTSAIIPWLPRDTGSRARFIKSE